MMSEQFGSTMDKEAVVGIQSGFTSPQVLQEFCPASLWRRLFAMFYDSFLVVAVLITGTAVALTFVPSDIPPGTIWFESYLLGLWTLFFCWFWTHGGQTTGMAAWKVRAVSQDLQPLTWKAAFLRFVFAWVCLLPFGMGLLWVFVDKEKRTLYECLSGTRLIRIQPR